MPNINNKISNVPIAIINNEPEINVNEQIENDNFKNIEAFIREEQPEITNLNQENILKNNAELIRNNLNEYIDKVEIKTIENAFGDTRVGLNKEFSIDIPFIDIPLYMQLMREPTNNFVRDERKF